MLKVSRQQVDRLVRTGKLPRVPTVCGCILIAADAVRRRARARPQRGRPPASLSLAPHNGGSGAAPGRTARPGWVLMEMVAAEHTPAEDGTWQPRSIGEIVEVPERWAPILARDGYADLAA